MKPLIKEMAQKSARVVKVTLSDKGFYLISLGEELKEIATVVGKDANEVVSEAVSLREQILTNFLSGKKVGLSDLKLRTGSKINVSEEMYYYISSEKEDIHKEDLWEE